MLCNKRLIKIRSWFLAAILSISTITGPLSVAASAATAISYYSGTIANDGDGNFISSQNRATTSFGKDTLKTLSNAIKSQSNQGVTDVTSFQTSGYVFDGWLIGETVYSPEENVKKVNSGSNLTAIAQWTEKANITINGEAVTSAETTIKDGSISLSAFPAAQGKDLTIKLIPEESGDNCYLETFTINGVNHKGDVAKVKYSSTLTYTLPAASVAENVNIVASFTKNNYSAEIRLEDTLDFARGTTTPEPLSITNWTPESVAKGGSFTFTIKPYEGYQVKALTLNGEDVTSSIVKVEGKNEFTYTVAEVTEDLSFKVSFESATTYKITITVPEGVTIDTATEFNVSKYSNPTIGIEANEGYRLTSVKVNGVESLASVILNNKLTLPLVREDKDIVITAEKGTYNVVTNAIGHGTISEGGVVEYGDNFEVTITPDEHYVLNKLVVCDSLLNCIIPKDVTTDIVDGKYTIENIAKDTYVTATFEKNNEEYAFDIETTEGVNIITPVKTNKRVGYGDTEIITFRLDEGYELSGIKINDEDIDALEFTLIAEAADNLSAAIITVPSIEGDTTVSISAKIKTYNLAATSTNILRGVVSPVLKINVKYGETYTLKITPYAGYELDKLTFNGKDITDKVKDNVYETVINKKSDIKEDGVFLASFKKKSYTITVDAPENITVDPADTTISAEYLDTKVLTITPADEYHDIESISINGRKLNAIELAAVKLTNKLTLPLISEDKDIVITSEESAYDIKTSVNGEGGTITESKIVKHGSDFLIKVTPDKYYKVDSFTVDGKAANLVAGYYLLKDVTSSHEVVVSFKLVSHDVRVYGSRGTIITPNSAKVEHGGNADFTVKAIHNYEIQNIYINGKPYTETLENDTLHLENVSRDTNVIVTAKKVAHDIITKVFGGHGAVSDWGNVADGESFTVTATPDDGYKVKAIYVNGRKVKFEDNSYTIKSVKHDIFVAVVFTEYFPTIEVITSEGVNIDEEVPAAVAYGSDLSIKITAKSGYYLDSIKVNGIKIELPLDENILTLTDIAEDTVIEISAKTVLAPDTGKGILVGENATPHMLSAIIVAAMASIAALLKKRLSNR